MPVALNKTDQQILRILKDVFLRWRVNPLASDHQFRLWFIRSMFLLSVLTIIAKLAYGEEAPNFQTIPVAFFFGSLFLHINNEVEETSLIVFVLTWISIVVAVYV